MCESVIHLRQRVSLSWNTFTTQSLWYDHYASTPLCWLIRSRYNPKQLYPHEVYLSCLPWCKEDISQYELCKRLTTTIQLNLIILRECAKACEEMRISDHHILHLCPVWRTSLDHQSLRLQSWFAQIQLCSGTLIVIVLTFSWMDRQTTLSIMHTWSKITFFLILKEVSNLTITVSYCFLSCSCHRPCSAFHLEHYW